MMISDKQFRFNGNNVMPFFFVFIAFRELNMGFTC